MTTEQHRILYNIGRRLSCGNSGNLHLCPSESNYKYFVYWSEACKRKDIKFGSTFDKKKIQLKRQTGIERVFLEEDVPICKRYAVGRRVEMVLTDSCGKTEYDSLVKELNPLLIQYIRDVAIEETLVLKENIDGWKMPMIDFTDVFNERVLLAHFRSLIYCFIEEVSLGNQGTDIIKRLTNLLENWEQIYNEKNDILGQIEYCMSSMIVGIEDMSEVPDDLRYLFGVFKEDFRRKRNAEDNLLFLLSEEYSRECFQECVTVLDAFLRAYAKNEVDALQYYLEKYKNEDLQIDKIRKLSKIDLQSSKAKQANLRLIREYLADKVKYNTGALFECIA